LFALPPTIFRTTTGLDAVLSVNGAGVGVLALIIWNRGKGSYLVESWVEKSDDKNKDWAEEEREFEKS